MITAKKNSPLNIIYEIKASKSHISLVSNKYNAEKEEVEKMTKEYLNEKLYYFYNNGGPIMEL